MVSAQTLACPRASPFSRMLWYSVLAISFCSSIYARINRTGTSSASATNHSTAR